jgi:hypothetical protein
MSRFKFFCWIAVGLLGLLACRKNVIDNLDADETPLYITKQEPSVDFSSYSTYSLADSVAVIQNDQLVERVRTDYDAAFIDAIAAQMQSRGFTRVSHSDSPDLGITISRIYNDYTGIIDYSYYWDYYDGYWGPDYWGYPGYDYYFPPVYGTYTVTDGGVALDMIDLKNAAVNNQLRQVWSGLVRGSGTFDKRRVSNHAQALFDQSPYLEK